VTAEDNPVLNGTPDVKDIGKVVSAKRRSVIRAKRSGPAVLQELDVSWWLKVEK